MAEELRIGDQVVLIARFEGDPEVTAPVTSEPADARTERDARGDRGPGRPNETPAERTEREARKEPGPVSPRGSGNAAVAFVVKAHGASTLGTTERAESVLARDRNATPEHLPARTGGVPAWTSSNPAVASVTANGDGLWATVVALSAGEATVSVRASEVATIEVGMARPKTT